MAIAQETTIQAYQLRAGGTRARMAILRMIAADSVHNFNPDTRLTPGDWRGARHYAMGTYAAAYCHGINQAPGNWYTHAGPQFRNERDAHTIVARLPRGWFTDEECDETAVGIVAGLPHGRFIAGFRWTSNDERVYYPEIFDDESDAAHMADEHARVFAESSREDSERFNRMTDAETRVDEEAREVCGLWPARNASNWCRDSLRDAIARLRESRQMLESATAEYEG